MPLISLHGQTYTYVVIKETRKSVRIKLLKANAIEIKSPRVFSLQKAEQILRQNERWIQEQNEQFIKKDTIKINQSLQSGSVLLWRGRPITLEIAVSEKEPASIILSGNTLQVKTASSDAFQQDLKKWYIDQSRKQLLERTAYWQKIMDIEIGKIHIKDQKTRWGSCSSLGNLNFNWRLVMAPPETMDYLIIHELCHCMHLNHSPKFWTAVSVYCPGYKQQQQWLKRNGYLLFRIL